VSEQTQLADQGAPALTGPCAWCQQTTGLRLAITPARYSARDGIRRVVRPAREVWCCADHQRSLELKDDA
jgi:hypothetical protein